MELSSSSCCCGAPQQQRGRRLRKISDSGCENADKTRHFAVGATVCSCSLLRLPRTFCGALETRCHCLLTINMSASSDIALPNAPVDDESRACDEVLSRAGSTFPRVVLQAGLLQLMRPLPLAFRDPHVLQAKARREGEQWVGKEEERIRAGVVAMRSSGC